jgi:hypothetical protein
MSNYIIYKIFIVMFDTTNINRCIRFQKKII